MTDPPRFENIQTAANIARKDAGISVEQLASACGVTRQVVGTSLRDGRIKLPTLLRILHALGARLVVETVKGERIVLRATEDRKGREGQGKDSVSARVVGQRESGAGEVAGSDPGA